MALPNFYILGAQKCGTTWLASTLRQHPDIFIPRSKEIHYFNVAANYARGSKWYESQFTRAGGAIAIGEATPEYLAVNWTEESAKVVERILAITPDARFIVCLRNPVTRAVSALLHHIRAGRISPLVNLDAEFDLVLSQRQSPYGVLEYGLYGKQIRSFLRHFEADRFIFIIYERDIVTNKRETLELMCGFLGVRANFAFRNIDVRRNPSPRKRTGLVLSQFLPLKRGVRLLCWTERLGLFGKELSISKETVQRLSEYYESDMAELASIIGQNLHIWQTHG